MAYLTGTVIEHQSKTQPIGIINGENVELNPDKNQIIEAGDRPIVLADEVNDFSALQAALGERIQSEAPSDLPQGG